MQLTEQQIQALAPDAQVASAGKKLGSAKPWGNVGISARALWGECKGSGAKPYQVRVDRSDYAAKCSCPSHKFPCKHAIGLLTLLTSQPLPGTASNEPEWVADWLNKRAETAHNKLERAQAPAEVDAAAQQKRQERRAGRIDDGLAALELWLADLMRRGLAQVAGEGPAFWEKQAARLVDAQAAGLANRLRALGEEVGAREDWPARTLDGLGQIALILKAWQRKESLTPALRRELETQIGMTVKEEDVLAHGERLQDEWQVIAQKTEDAGRLRARWTWLLGRQSQRYALLLHTAVNQQAYAENFVPGTSFQAPLRFWPGSYPLRALIEGNAANTPAPQQFWHAETLAGFLARHADALAANPWLQRLPLVLEDAVPVQQDGQWWVVDCAGEALPVQANSVDQLWTWTAHCGGRPCAIAGEWRAGAFNPMALYLNQRYLTLDS